MPTWKLLSGISGYYVSEPVEVSLDSDGALTRISWDCEEPLETSIQVQTSLSRNGGYDWTDWKTCVNNNSLPDTYEEQSINFLLRFRVFINRNDYLTRPVLKSIEVLFDPILIIDNRGDTKLQPEIWITKEGHGDFKMINTSFGNEEFSFVGLSNNETVYVNNEREFIETDLALTYRYNSFNDKYLNLPPGKNIFRINGNAKIRLRYQYKTVQ
ncbi:hypothetical protein EBB07_29590 [Paenibacillaceae bacterium]|nr:hypothetical protein EBB07_29590 [Paenibacillaceae bacterium]